MKKRKKNKSAHPVTIAYIGGGSRGWAHTLMGDLALCPHLTGEVRLYDIDRPMAQRNARWGRRVNDSPDARSEWRFRAPKTLAKALKGADFVVASIQPGPIEMMHVDVGVPAKYGILHPVGDTIGPAGHCRSLRAVGEYATIGRAVGRYCPKAWVINYTNPMTVCTRTLYKVFPEIRAFGCCHGVFGTQDRLALLVKEHCGVRPKRKDIRLNVLGVNHFTWTDNARWEDVDLIELFARHWRRKGMVHKISEEELDAMGPWEDKGQVGYDLFRRYGILPAISTRHLVEFLPFYLKDLASAHRWGVRLTPVAQRVARYTEAPKRFAKLLASKQPFRLKHSSEEGVEQMMAILGLGDLHTNVNLPNVGQMDDLPRGAVVETNAYFTKGSVKPAYAGSMPAGAGAWVQRTVSNQEILVEAALNRDKDLAFQAFLNDPLMNLPTDTAWKMFRQMLRGTKDMLDGWKI